MLYVCGLSCPSEMLNIQGFYCYIFVQVYEQSNIMSTIFFQSLVLIISPYGIKLRCMFCTSILFLFKFQCKVMLNCLNQGSNLELLVYRTRALANCAIEAFITQRRTMSTLLTQPLPRCQPDSSHDQVNYSEQEVLQTPQSSGYFKETAPSMGYCRRP